MKFQNYLSLMRTRTEQKRSSKLLSWIGACSMLLAAAWLPAAAHAGTCQSNNNDQKLLVVTVAGFNVNASSLKGPGTVLGTNTQTWQVQSGYWTCTSTVATYLFTGVGTPMTVKGISGVFPTNIPGVGVRFSLSPSVGQFPSTYNANAPAGQSFSANAGFSLTTTLIQTGAITQAGDLVGEIGQVYLQGPALVPTSIQYLSIQLSTPIHFIPTTPTCVVNDTSINVPMNPAAVSDFSGAGSTAGSAIPFNLALTCSGGNTGTSTNMYITLTDATNSGNVGDMLTPTADSTATGVGIRIFNGATAVKFGPDSDAVGNTNQWKVNSTPIPGNATTNVNIPLTAKYVQLTGTPVGSGTVKALATFTMAYN